MRGQIRVGTLPLLPRTTSIYMCTCRLRRYPSVHHGSAKVGSPLERTVQKSRYLHRPNRLRKRVVFERNHPNRKSSVESGLNGSRNSFLISASQKVRVRLSFERVHDDQRRKTTRPAPPRSRRRPIAAKAARGVQFHPPPISRWRSRC